MWSEDIAIKCVEYGVKQADIAKLCGIHPKTFSAIKNGRRDCSESLKKKIEVNIEKFNPKYKLYAIYDYVRVRFPTHDHVHIMTDFLRMKPEFFILEPIGFYGYKAQYVFSDISIMIAPEDDNRGTLLELMLMCDKVTQKNLIDRPPTIPYSLLTTALMCSILCL